MAREANDVQWVPLNESDYSAESVTRVQPSLTLATQYWFSYQAPGFWDGYSSASQWFLLRDTKIAYYWVEIQSWIYDASPTQDEPSLHSLVQLIATSTGLATSCRLLGSETAILVPVSVNKHMYTRYIASYERTYMFYTYVHVHMPCLASMPW